MDTRAEQIRKSNNNVLSFTLLVLSGLLGFTIGGMLYGILIQPDITTIAAGVGMITFSFCYIISGVVVVIIRYGKV